MKIQIKTASHRPVFIKELPVVDYVETEDGKAIPIERLTIGQVRLWIRLFKANMIRLHKLP